MRTIVRLDGAVVTFGEGGTIRVRHAYAYDAEQRNLPRIAAREGVEQRYWQALEYTESKDITLPADASLDDLHNAIAEVVAYRCARVNHIPDGSVETFDTETGGDGWPVVGGPRLMARHGCYGVFIVRAYERDARPQRTFRLAERAEAWAASQARSFFKQPGSAGAMLEWRVCEFVDGAWARCDVEECI